MSALKTVLVPPADEEVSDSALERFLGYRMKRAFNVVQADLAETLKPFDLRMTSYTALVLIMENPGLNQSQLAAVMDIERPNLVVIVDELERRDLIVRDRLETDRRTYALSVTLAGRRLCETAMKAVEGHEARLLGRLSPEMRDTVAEAMILIRAGEAR
ncbi:MarR family transcriptional regulator [Nisaea acidiphila]|uniref:MarR family transcriptional regulator n=1 Tax=Nisaea acidiphila TaxID=1862145 RepID=A0A9J7AP63_9PROT|nr:MarR family transcriptional regulator [Nisaea acidiphila]UUX48958.1 MarR family transcriptional regulator [Nisaea acidiphila]